jgi:hypothetical protein
MCCPASVVGTRIAAALHDLLPCMTCRLADKHWAGSPADWLTNTGLRCPWPPLLNSQAC